MVSKIKVIRSVRLVVDHAFKDDRLPSEVKVIWSVRVVLYHSFKDRCVQLGTVRQVTGTSAVDVPAFGNPLALRVELEM